LRKTPRIRKAPRVRPADLRTALDNQRRLGRRLLWLLSLPFCVTAIIVWMYYHLSMRLADVEIGTKLVTIERYIVSDQNYPWAIDQYEKIAKTNATAPILARLGMLYFLQDRRNESIALEKLEMAKRADPANWEVYRNLTFIYLATDRKKEAIEAGQRALELNSNDANTYNNLAWIYATSDEPAFHNLPRAQEYAEKAVRLTREKQSEFLDTLAEVYFRKGDRDRALDSFQKARAVTLGDTLKIQTHFKKLFSTEMM
jgi:tetratricopeptide (TPR) repeat protein